jgi:hypothetical protein
MIHQELFSCLLNPRIDDQFSIQFKITSVFTYLLLFKSFAVGAELAQLVPRDMILALCRVWEDGLSQVYLMLPIF